jgi:RNA polymerase sigma factor (TIGR02999 family)
MAHQQLRRGPADGSLDTTALVHETYLKLVGRSRIDCEDRTHFLALVATAMRQIIIDFARRRQASKRGSGVADLPLICGFDEAVEDNVQGLIEIDQALTRLASLDDRLTRVVECRFFAGFTEDETAEALGVSRSTIQRDWARARAWLRDEMAHLNNVSETN